VFRFMDNTGRSYSKCVVIGFDTVDANECPSFLLDREADTYAVMTHAMQYFRHDTVNT
jgi:hypothetical protein